MKSFQFSFAIVSKAFLYYHVDLFSISFAVFFISSHVIPSRLHITRMFPLSKVGDIAPSKKYEECDSWRGILVTSEIITREGKLAF